MMGPRPGSVVVEHSPGMREFGGSIPGRDKQKTLKFEVNELDNSKLGRFCQFCQQGQNKSAIHLSYNWPSCCKLKYK